MLRQFFGPSIGLASLLLASLLFTSAAAQAQDTSPACDRACLRRMLDTYMTAVFKHDPTAVPMTADHYATENTTVVHNGEGFWKDVSGYGTAQGRYFDPVNETAAFLGLLKQNGQDVVTSVRIRVDGGKVSEAEWIVGTHGMMGKGDANPQGLAQHPPIDTILPPSERSSRFMMVALANNYFQSNKDHDASWIPDDPDCVRLENGVGASGGAEQAAQQKAAAPGVATVSQGSAQGSARRRGCLVDFSGMDKITTDLAVRRFPVVDEEAGMVLGTGIYVRYAGLPLQHNLVSEYFLIRKDKIHGIWSAMYFLPMGAPDSTGWENRHGIWR
jgi:hypothetical protein